MSSTDDFARVFEDFLNKVKNYNSKQKKEILQLTSEALYGVISSFPAPKSDDLEVQFAEMNIDEDCDDPKFKRWIDHIEAAVSERLYSLNYNKNFFYRYDTKITGCVTMEQFYALMLMLSLYITPAEIQGFQRKYPGPNNTINYNELLLVLEAKRAHPTWTNTHTNSYISTILNRKIPDGAQVDAFLSSIQEPLNLRLERGLSQMRTHIYQKFTNYLNFYHKLQNEKKAVDIVDLASKMEQYGFPKALCTPQELQDACTAYSKTTQGCLTYHEFLSFIKGQEPFKGDNTGNYDHHSPALMETLAKINSLNLRKIFKEMDSDCDGLISTSDLADGLVSYGLPKPIAQSQSFTSYLDSFSKKNKGTFGYGEFVKFASTRISGQSTKINGVPVLPLPHIQLSASNTFTELFLSICDRAISYSIEQICMEFDNDEDGNLSINEFNSVVTKLAIQCPSILIEQLFNAFDEDQVGLLSINEFTKTVALPSRNPRLGLKARRAPGGESQVPLGDIVSADKKPEPQRRMSVKMVNTPHKDSHIDASSLIPTEMESPRPMKQYKPSANPSTIDLTFDPVEPPMRQPRPETRQSLDAPDPIITSPQPEQTHLYDVSYRRVKQPPGGYSSVNFSGDHGAVPAVVPPRTAEKNVESAMNEIASPAPNSASRRGFTAGGPSSFSLAYSDQELQHNNQLQRDRSNLRSPGGRSSVSFDQSDFEVYRPLTKHVAPTGGKTSIQIEHPEIPNSQATPNRVFSPRKSTNNIISFDSDNGSTSPGRRVKRSVDIAPPSTIKISHSPVRTQEEDPAPRKSSNNIIQTYSVTNDNAKKILEKYSDSKETEIPSQVINTIVTAVFTNSQRPRHLFQDWNKSSTNSTLTKSNFKNGLASIKVNLDDNMIDLIYNKYDSDLDGELSYSEFIRLLSSNNNSN